MGGAQHFESHVIFMNMCNILVQQRNVPFSAATTDYIVLRGGPRQWHGANERNMYYNLTDIPNTLPIHYPFYFCEQRR